MSTPTRPGLRAQSLTLRYGAHPAVEDANLSVTAGQVTALIGPNGSGKSTLLRSLSRLHPAPAGHITLTSASGSSDVSLLSGKEFAREVTLFTQSRPAVDGLSVRDIVAFGRQPYRAAFRGLSATDTAAIDDALEVTGITAMAERSAAQLSGGELQRVWLAVCLAQQTDVLLLDEPTNHLDLRYQVQTLDLVRDLADHSHTAIGVVLHDLDHAARIADSLVLMSEGRVRASGTVDEVLTGDILSEVYSIPITVSRDSGTGRYRIDADSRSRSHR
ncbi:MAG: ABC transporter ATP-binding protein [Mycetocola sp.]